jgi:spermidine synthase
VVRTFLSVFPETTFWGRGDIMVGSKRPVRVDRATFDRKMRDPVVRETAESIGIKRYEDLAEQFRATAEDMRRYVGEGPVLTDDRPMVEYFLSLGGGDRPADLRQVPRNPSGVVEP